MGDFLKNNWFKIIVLLLLGIIIYLLFFKPKYKISDNLNTEQINLLEEFDSLKQNLSNLKYEIEISNNTLSSLNRELKENKNITDKQLKNIRALIKTNLNFKGNVEAQLEPIKNNNKLLKINPQLVENDSIGNISDYYKLETILSKKDNSSMLLLNGVIDLKNLKFIGEYEYYTTIFHSIMRSRKNIFTPYTNKITLWSEDANLNANLEGFIIKEKQPKFSFGLNISYSVFYDNNKINFSPTIGVGINYNLIHIY